MNTIILHTDGQISHNGNIVESEALMFLPFKIELEDGFTLRTYFRMPEKYPLLGKLSMFFPDLMKQYLKSPVSGCVADGIGHLELSKTVEMIGFPGEPRMEIYNSFHGVFGKEHFELKRYKLEDLLDMPVKLGRLKHIVFGDKVDIFEFDTVFTLFELIDAVAWELSFQTGPMECQLRR